MFTVPSPFARHSFLHRITTPGEITLRYLFHEVEEAASFAEMIIICENNYSRYLLSQTVHRRCLTGF